MTTFTINADNNITAYPTLDHAEAAISVGAQAFTTEKQLAKIARTGHRPPRRHLERLRRSGSLRRAQAGQEVREPHQGGRQDLDRDPGARAPASNRRPVDAV